MAAGTDARTARRAATSRPDARRAAAVVLDKHSLRVTLPDDLGTVRVPEPQRLAFYAGLAALAVLGVVEWPVALVLGIGHMLAEDHNHKLLSDFGEALEEA